MKIIKAKDLKQGDKVSDLPPTNTSRTIFTVTNVDEELRILTLQTKEQTEYIVDEDGCIDFLITNDDWYLV